MVSHQIVDFAYQKMLFHLIYQLRKIQSDRQTVDVPCFSNVRLCNPKNSFIMLFLDSNYKNKTTLFPMCTSYSLKTNTGPLLSRNLGRRKPDCKAYLLVNFKFTGK